MLVSRAVMAAFDVPCDKLLIVFLFGPYVLLQPHAHFVENCVYFPGVVYACASFDCLTAGRKRPMSNEEGIILRREFDFCHILCLRKDTNCFLNMLFHRPIKSFGRDFTPKDGSQSGIVLQVHHLYDYLGKKRTPLNSTALIC